MPKVDAMRLDQAEVALEARDIDYKTIGPDVHTPEKWMVCSQAPDAGAAVDQEALLTIARPEECPEDIQRREQAEEKTSSQDQAAVSFVRGNCTEDTWTSEVIFAVYLKNKIGRPVEYTVLPVRYYSDGTSNRSPLDELFGDLPPKKSTLVWHRYKIEPDHFLTGCEAEITVGGKTRVVELPVD